MVFVTIGSLDNPAGIEPLLEMFTKRRQNNNTNLHFHGAHTNPIQVMEIGGQSLADQPWRDTVTVPRPAKGGSTVFRSRFLDYTGIFMLHCHMMNHEEMGMQSVEVYKD